MKIAFKPFFANQIITPSWGNNLLDACTIPGLDVYMPSNASDAAGMLNAAFDLDVQVFFSIRKNWSITPDEPGGELVILLAVVYWGLILRLIQC